MCDRSSRLIGVLAVSSILSLLVQSQGIGSYNKFCSVVTSLQLIRSDAQCRYEKNKKKLMEIGQSVAEI